MKTFNKIYYYLTENISGDNLGVFRILTAAVTIAMMVTLLPDLLNIYGSKSYFNHEIMQLFKTDIHPTIQWLSVPMQNLLGFNEETSLYIIVTLYIVSLILLMFGIATRYSAFFSLIFCAMFTSSGEPFIYGADFFILSCLFYCFLFPVSNSFTIFHLFKKKASIKVFRFYTLFLLVHLCMVYFFNGFAKSLGDTWYSGEAIWRSVMLLDTRQYDMSFLSNFPTFLKYSSLIILTFELLFPILIIKRITRIPTMFVIISMHMCIGIFMGLYFFAAIMITLNITVFYSDFAFIYIKVKEYWSFKTLQKTQINTKKYLLPKNITI